MRRYSPRGAAFTWGKAMVFFGAWNIIGITVYSYIIKREEEREPGQWKDASGAQHYLRFMNFGGENVQKITVKGLSSVKMETLTQEDVQKLKGYNPSETESS